MMQEAGIAAARNAAADAHSAISLAVLPFVNLSSDKEQEFFCDGMTEEITAALAKVPDLRVVARTSAFEFKSKNVNIKTMGEQLGATHLIEGSVRKAGNRLRITAQLIKADDGTHIWAKDYDRELTDVFAVQEDITRAITTSLRMPLGLKPGENLVNNRKIDPIPYTNYLRVTRVDRTSECTVVSLTS
jgi:TolB-like protein